jgi:hypothetical protein
LSLIQLLTIAGAATFRFLGAGPLADGGISSVRDTSVGRADVDMGDFSTVAGAGTPFSRAPVVAGACALSACTSIGIGSTVCKSESKVGGCVVDASGQPVGMPGWLSRLLSISSSLQTMSA